MTIRLLLVTVLCGMCLVHALAESDLTRTKRGSIAHKKHIHDIEKKLDAILELEAELENEIAGVIPPSDNDDQEEDEDEAADDQAAKDEQMLDDDPGVGGVSGGTEEVMEDPCAGVLCSAGRACMVSMEGKGACQCVEACEEETDPRRRVCSNHNETWMTDCDLHRQRCLCTDGHDDCQDEMYKHLHIDYYGQCQELPECTPDELVDFPRRMREWLFNVMRDMADRQILSSHYQQLEQQAEEDESQKWSNAVVWKWCDLDGHPRDKVVSRHELFPLRAPLHTLEHCISTFLDSCDPDDDHLITLKEWGRCLKLDQGDLDSLDVLCEDIRDSEEDIRGN